MVHLPPDAPSPRLCVLEKTTPSQEYGYNLHAEKTRGQFVGVVDKSSPAEIGGLRAGDKIYAVNGVSIIGEPHKKVVQRIKEDPMRCEMLVISEDGAQWYKEHDITIDMSLPNIVRGNAKERLHFTRPSPLISHHFMQTAVPVLPRQPPPPSNGSPPPAAGWYAPNYYKVCELMSLTFVTSCFYPLC